MPSPGMALVTSKSTVCPCATAPRVASAGPSIAGRVFQVTVPSFHPQSVIAWRRPPVTLWALVTFATCSRRWAPVTWRAPTVAVSAVVEALPSLDGRVFGAFTQPLAGLQESVVHTLPSLQLSGRPPTHTPPAHVSAVVHAFPSLHGRVFGTCSQPFAGLH